MKVKTLLALMLSLGLTKASLCRADNGDKNALVALNGRYPSEESAGRMIEHNFPV